MNNDNQYIKWYREHHKPHIKRKREYVVNDTKYNNLPTEDKPTPRIKMTNIEKARRKIELNLAKNEARRQAWHFIQ
jgi:hypothetical protein